MAEGEADVAKQHQLLQVGQRNTESESEGANGAAESDPSNTENNNLEDDQSLRVFSPSSSTPVPTVAVAGEESRSSSRASSRRPRTVGGFIADDSDEEDQATPAPASLQVPATQNRTISPSPLQNSVTSTDTGVPGDSTSVLGSVIAPPVTSTGVSPIVQAPTGAQAAAAAVPLSVTKARLPHDKVGILEDRIVADPKGDIAAWQELIAEHRTRHKINEVRAVYERFLELFPQSAEMWVQYMELEIEHDNFGAVEALFGKSLLTVPNVPLWTMYLNYIRRMNDLSDDATGNKRTTVSQSYDFVLNNIGVDKESGWIWQEYIQFLRTIPGQIGGSTWQDQQKLDVLRKAYHKAICIPMSTVTPLWKEYDQFELTVNKTTARKYIQEKSPAYMTARSANNALDSITRGLIRSTLPKLPPLPGYDGHQEYIQQVEGWKKWISWEQEDPLVLKIEEPESYKKRVIYAYKQAVMTMRFWPEFWADAADWCYANGRESDGDEFLIQGIAANPESCLLAFKHADRLETTLSGDDKAAQGAIVRAPYNKLLDALYELLKHVKVREAAALIKLDESAAIDASIAAITGNEADEENEDEKKAREDAKKRDQDAVKEIYKEEETAIKRPISFTWIALMRAMRRIQGKGAPKTAIGGSRQVFSDARQRGKILSEVYVTSAMIEHHVYKDASGTKIFERGAKLFPEDAPFILEYLRHLVTSGDFTNARVAFETAVSRLTAKPELVSKSKILYSYFHRFESQFGELPQIRKLEQRMAELFPTDPKLQTFAARYSSRTYDPVSYRAVISPAFQMRKGGPTVMQSIEPVHDSPGPSPQYMQERSPRPQYLAPQPTNSPKRPHGIDELQDELTRPRKIARGQSPLKGAAGRRLEQQQRLQQQTGGPAWQPSAPPFVVPRDITFLMSIIPRADTYVSTRFNPESMVRLLANTYVPDFNAWKAQQGPQFQPRRL